MIKREELENSCKEEQSRVLERYKATYEEFIDNKIKVYYSKKRKDCTITLCPERESYLFLRLAYVKEVGEELVSLEDKVSDLGNLMNDAALWRKSSLEVIESYLSEYYVRGRRRGNGTEIESVVIYFEDPNDGYGHTFFTPENTSVWVPTEESVKKVDKKPWYKRLFG